MAKDTAYPQSTALSKTGSQAIDVSDYRKQTQTFAVFSKGVRTPEDIVEATAALGADLAAGRLQIADVAAHCGVLDRNLHVKDQQLQHEEIQLKLKITSRRAKMGK